MKNSTVLVLQKNISNDLIREASDFYQIEISELVHIKLFQISSESDVTSIQKELFGKSLHEEVITEIPQGLDFAIEILTKNGVTDNSGKALEEALAMSKIQSTVKTGEIYLLKTKATLGQLNQFAHECLANILIQQIKINPLKTFKITEKTHLQIPQNNTSMVDVYDFTQEQEQLVKLSESSCWALNDQELTAIQHFYQEEETIKTRRHLGLPSNPTDVEIEVIAQTWSEHCKHKIFSAEINYTEEEGSPNKIGDIKIQSLFKNYIKKSTNDINADFAVSVFEDNAGIIRFDDQIDHCIKVETHNSPSALDPYGGAITGILGVNRDILGCGMGARPVANMDVFCLASPNKPTPEHFDELPMGVRHPRQILRGVHQGVKDGGNKSGIPTVNGSISFDESYTGKPLVFVGTVGILPQEINGKPTSKKQICPGDLIVMAGGLVGRDGIHGATFSSLKLDEEVSSNVVQIGDPLTQKRLTEFIIEARDQELFNAITDNGAGGLSSSVGEMAEMSNGARIQLHKVPKKCTDLKPFEILISESQERMTLAVDPIKYEQLKRLALDHGVIISNIGEFTETGNLEAYYHSEMVALIPMNFLHHGNPKLELNAVWKNSNPKNSGTIESNDLKEKIHTLLSSPNICSKQGWVDQYDQEVQGATLQKPFIGKTQQGPSDAGIIWNFPHGGSRNKAVAISNGLCARLSTVDPYLMAQFAHDEALRNITATGANPAKVAMLDNFCWPDPIQSKNNPEGEYKLAQLVRSCAGLYESCMIHQTPLVSGKDSMKNDFKGKNRRGDSIEISVLPTLLMTAIGDINVQEIISSEFKSPGDHIFIIGKQSTGLLGSEYATHFKLHDSENTLPELNLEDNKKIYQMFYENRNLWNSAHDVSEGGKIVSIIESCFGNNLGADLQLNQDALNLFSESPGQIVVSVDANQSKKVEHLFGESCELVGVVTNNDFININQTKILVKDLLQSWKKELIQ